jgi:LacI family transcriptional regulator
MNRASRSDPQPATIRDVAREAGVSIATISRVFNGSARVSDPTSERVREVAARLGYWPNGAARSLITKRTHSLGVLLPDLYGEFFSEVIRGIDLGARREGYHLMVSSSHADPGELMTVLRSMRGRIDGLIAMAPDSETPNAVEEFADRFPVVLLNPGRDARRCHTLAVANVEGAERVVRHLIDLGHRRVAIVRGPDRNVDAEQRLQGYRAAMSQAGLEPIETEGAFTEASGFAAAQHLLRRDPRPTAIFAANDGMAVGALSALRQAGVGVPDEMALAGFDGIATAEYLHPPLTTVQVDPYRLGERAVQILLESLRDGTAGAVHHEVVRTALVVRETCGAPRGSNGRATPATESS